MLSATNRIFGPLLRAKRQKTGKRLVAFANECGVDPGLYSRYETGQRLPPELPWLVVIARHLGIEKESDEFAELLAAADHDRDPAGHAIAMGMHGGKPWNPFNRPNPDVSCASVSELISEAMQKAVEVQASAISVQSPAGRVTTFRLRQGKAKPVKAKR